MPQIRRPASVIPPKFQDSTSSRPFLPPSHYAAAAGIPYQSNLIVSHGQAVENADKDAQKHSFMASSPREPRSSSLGRKSFVSVSHTPPPPSSESLQSPALVGRTPSRAAKRRSNLDNLPLMEVHLLPSLKDTVDRMTRNPARTASPASSSSELSAWDSRSRSASLSTTESGLVIAPSTRHPPTLNATTETPLSPFNLGDIPFVSQCTPVQTSTPKAKPKAALKSALKSSTPNLEPMGEPSIAHATTPTISLRSVKSIVGACRKTPYMPIQANAAITVKADESVVAAMSSLAKSHIKDLKSNEKLHTPRPNRSRSRTDPGTSLRLLDPKPKPPATPQPPLWSSDIRPHTGRLHQDKYEEESELEYRFEMEAKEKRRLVVTNANIVPSSSESDGENNAKSRNFKTRLPVLARKWGPSDRGKNATDNPRVGLGFNFHGYINEDEIRRGNVFQSPADDDDDSSVYDQEPDLDATVCSTGYSADQSFFSSQSRMSLDKLDEAHRRRREALLGIVSGLEAESGEIFEDFSRSEESDYYGQEGLAISGSADLRVAETHTERAAQSRCMSTMTFVTDDNNEGSQDRTPVASTAPEKTVEDNQRTSQGYSTGNTVVSSLQIPTQASTSRGRPEADCHNVNMPSGNRKASRSPIIRTSTGVSLPAPLRRYSVYQTCESGFCNDSATAGTERASTGDATSQVKNSQSTAARERKALGIPPSESDKFFQYPIGHETGVMAHTDSILSSVDSNLWLQDCDELSVGAEELFRKLSGKSDSTWSGGTNGDTKVVDTVEDNILATENAAASKSTWRLSVRHSNASSLYEDFDDDTHLQNSEDAIVPVASSEAGKWRSTLSESTYDSLRKQYGELEMKRQEVIWELWKTESAFVKKMQTKLGLFVKPLRVKNTRIWISGVPLDVARLFDWLEDILNVHTQILSVLQAALAEQSPIIERIAAPLKTCIARFEVYQPYMVRLGDATETIRSLRQEPENDFGEFVRIQERETDGHGWSLERFLTEPLNRLELYPILFERLKDLTPKNHVDFLATLLLFHSTNIVMRVMAEVKVREDQYGLVKDILVRIRGLQPCIKLAKRERRLLAHGLLEKIGDSVAVNASTLCPTEHHAQERDSMLVETFDERAIRRNRAGSVKSTLSSATGASLNSSESRSSASSGFPLTPSSECFPSRYNIASPSPKSKMEVGFTSLKLSDGYRDTRRWRSPTVSCQENKTRTFHVFVFSDAVLFTTPHPLSDVEKDGATWSLVDEIGIARVLAVAEISGLSGSIIEVDVLPMDPEDLDTGIVSDKFPVKSVTFRIPGDVSGVSANHPNETSGDADIRQKWLSAFGESSQNTLRLLSYSSLQFSGPGQNRDLEVDTQQSVKSILAAGLPLPKSPSFQKREESRGIASDTAQMEREERGWWTLRFQQVLREIQRKDG